MPNWYQIEIVDYGEGYASAVSEERWTVTYCGKTYRIEEWATDSSSGVEVRDEEESSVLEPWTEEDWEFFYDNTRVRFLEEKERARPYVEAVQRVAFEHARDVANAVRPNEED